MESDIGEVSMEQTLLPTLDVLDAAAGVGSGITFQLLSDGSGTGMDGQGSEMGLLSTSTANSKTFVAAPQIKAEKARTGAPSIGAPSVVSHATGLGRAIAPKPPTANKTDLRSPTVLLAPSPGNQISTAIQAPATMKLATKNTIPMALVPTSDGQQMIAVPLSVLNANTSGKTQVITIPMQNSTPMAVSAKGKQTLIGGPIKAKMVISNPGKMVTAPVMTKSVTENQTTTVPEIKISLPEQNRSHAIDAGSSSNATVIVTSPMPITSSSSPIVIKQTEPIMPSCTTSVSSTVVTTAPTATQATIKPIVVQSISGSKEEVGGSVSITNLTPEVCKEGKNRFRTVTSNVNSTPISTASIASSATSITIVANSPSSDGEVDFSVTSTNKVINNNNNESMPCTKTTTTIIKPISSSSIKEEKIIGGSNVIEIREEKVKRSEGLKQPTVIKLKEESKLSEENQVNAGTTNPTIQVYDPGESRVCLNCGVKGLRSNFIRQGKFCSQNCATITSNQLRTMTKRGKAIAGSVQKRKLMELPGDKLGKLRRMSNENSVSGRSHSPETIEANEEVHSILTSTDNEKKAFSWKIFLRETKSLAASRSMFKTHQCAPGYPNGFRVGMKLEGIDLLQHPSMFCVLSVADVQGFRIRLHFDGYKDCYDFWQNADSPFIFPAGWCERTGRKLEPPRIYNHQFSWSSYLQESKAIAAPKSLFPHSKHSVPNPAHGFKVGMKLEAVDKANSSLVCVATISDIISNWILIHFDGWDDSYDYWTTPDSYYIHPINWCRSKGRSLTPPKDYPRSGDRFSWEDYLIETSSIAAPIRLFKPRSSNNFKSGMCVEAVDLRYPKLIRVATIIHRASHSVKIHFTSWDEKYDFWLDDDSPDLHPVNWCALTGHIIQPPPLKRERGSGDGDGTCPTPCCKGVGHIKGPRFVVHHNVSTCPYSDVNLEYEPPDRLGREREDGQGHGTKVVSSEFNVGPLKKEKKRGRKRKDGGSLLNGDVDEASSTNSVDSILPHSRSNSPSISNPSVLHQSIFAMRMNQQYQDAPVAWKKHSKNLLEIAEKVTEAQSALKWSPETVAAFVTSIPGCRDFGNVFIDEAVDGEAFLLLNQTDLVTILGLKLGPSVKIFNSILVLRDKVNIDE